MANVLADPTLGGADVGDEFGPRPGIGDGYHGGLDFPGQFPVYAAADGVVIPSNYDGRAGNSLIIRHSQYGVSTGYAHLADGSLLVQPGDAVRLGDRIGTSGSTGFSTGNHLHFEVIPSVNGALPGDGSQNRDPRDWINFSLRPGTTTTTNPEIEGIDDMFLMRDVADGGTYLLTANGRYHFTDPSHVTLFRRLFKDRAEGVTSQFNQLQCDQVRNIVKAVS